MSKQTIQEPIDDTTEDGIQFDQLPPERQQRLIGITDLQRRGITVSAISKILGAGEATIYRDLKLIKQFKINRFMNVNIPEELGDALQLFDEIAAKAMESHRASIEDNTEVVYELDKDGQKKAIMKNIPDHAQANRSLQTALVAKKTTIDILSSARSKAGLDLFMSALAEKNKTGLIDVSQLKNGELGSAFDQIENKIKETKTRADEIMRRTHSYDGPNPFDYDDHNEYEKDMATHMARFDEYLKKRTAAEKLLAPWIRIAKKTKSR
jgi:hypothetical protein